MDVIKESIDDAKKNAKKHGIKNAAYVTGTIRVYDFFFSCQLSRLFHFVIQLDRLLRVELEEGAGAQFK
jgi:hypothetical protein